MWPPEEQDAQREGELTESRWPDQDDWKASVLVSSLTLQERNLQVQQKH